MLNRPIAAFVAETFLGLQTMPAPAPADNQIGYRLLTVEQAEALWWAEPSRLPAAA